MVHSSIGLNRYNQNYFPKTSAQAALHRSHILSSHASCSGFISTERRQVTVPVLICVLVRALKPGHRQLYKGQVQIARGAGHKDLLRQLRGLLVGLRVQLPDHNIQFRRACCERLEAPVLTQSPVQFQSRRAALRQSARKFAPGFSGKSFCVAHNATAAAPAREHSRLISPRCNCFDVK